MKYPYDASVCADDHNGRKTAAIVEYTSESGFDTNRRLVMKMAVGAVATASVAPVFGAMPSTEAHSDLSWQEQYLRASVEGRVGLEFVDSKSIDGFMAHGQLTVFNRTHHDLVLADFSPVFIVTSNGRYDVSAFLKRRPVRIPANKQRHIWIHPETAVNSGLASAIAPTAPGEPVQVNLAIESSQTGIGTSQLYADLKLELPNYKPLGSSVRQFA